MFFWSAVGNWLYFNVFNIFLCLSADEEGICESRHFTENGLVHLVEKTAQFMEKAQMYEMMPLVYKVLRLPFCASFSALAVIEHVGAASHFVGFC